MQFFRKLEFSGVSQTRNLYSQLIKTIFYEVVRPLKKKRVYGLGNKGYIDSSNKISSNREHLRDGLYDKVQDAVRKEMRNELQDAVREIKDREDAIQKMQENMELMMRRDKNRWRTIGSKSNKRWS